MAVDMERSEVAYHEAGHVVAHYVLRAKYNSVTIEPTDDYAGYVGTPNPWRSFVPETARDTTEDRNRLEKFAMLRLAGPIAQEIFLGTSVPDWTGRTGDWGAAFDALCYISGSYEEATAHVEWLKHRTRRMFLQRDGIYFTAVEAVAKALLAKGRLSYRESRKITKSAISKFMLDAIGQARPETPAL